MESVPFKAIDSLIDSLVNHLSHLTSAEAAVLMPRDVHSLAHLFPVVGRIESVAGLPRRPIEISDQQESNRRAIGALRELLARMGDRYPLVVYIDDLQWGDEDSAAMLSDLLQPPDPPLLLFLGTYRSEDGDTSRFLQSFRRIQFQRESPLEFMHIDIGPLDPPDATRLALSLLKRDDADARSRAESIADEAAGNPFFVSELVKHFQMGGGLVSNSTEPLFDMIWSRVQQLHLESQQLLAVVALAGQPMPLERAMHIADVGQSAVGPLRNGHLVRTVGLVSSSKIETYHDRVRETVSQRLDGSRKRQHHLRIAEDCVRHSPLTADEIMARLNNYFSDESAKLDDHVEVAVDWYDIAFHFDAADRPDLAFPFALATAEKARGQFSLEVAEKQYRIATRDVHHHDDTARYRVAEGLGDVLMLRGKYPEAAEQFETAQQLVLQAHARARIEGEIGELAFKQGDNKTASEALERSLRLLGRRIPSMSALFVLFLAWEVFVQTWHTLLPKLFLARRRLQGTGKEFLAIRLYTRLAYGYFFDRGKIPCLWAHLRAINLAERYPPTIELGHAWATHAPVMSLIPWLSRGEAFAQKSFEIRQQLSDAWGQGQSLHYWGIVLFVGARFDQCIDKCRQAVALLERTGDYWEVNIARYSIANSIYRRGDLRRAVSEAKRLYQAASEIGDDKVSGFILDVWSRATGGRLPAEVVRRELQKERHDVQATAQVLLAEAVRLLGQDELDEAEKTLIQAREVCRKVGMQNAWVSPVFPWLTTTLRMQWQTSIDLDPRHRRKLLHRAYQTSRQALAMARKFETDLPHALREAGLVAAMRGSFVKANKYFGQSLDVAQAQGAEFERAQTLLARGNLGRKLAWPGAEEEAAAARQAIIAMGGDFALPHCEVP